LPGTEAGKTRLRLRTNPCLGLPVGALSKGIVTLCLDQLVKKYPFKRKLHDKNIDQKMGYKKPEHQKNGRRSKRQLHFLN
jgi:hypothetical protein